MTPVITVSDGNPLWSIEDKGLLQKLNVYLGPHDIRMRTAYEAARPDE